MREYFREDGCLTNEAFAALSSGEELSELTRLEIAEHLSFCDCCTLRYTEFLSEAPLLEPPEEMAETVLSRLRHRAQMIFFNRYVAAGLAACFALILLGSGFFTSLMERTDQGLSAFSKVNAEFSWYSGEKLSEFSQTLSAIASKWNEAFYDREDKKGE